MGIEESLKELEALINKAWNVPLTGGKCLLDVGHLENILYDIRANLPLDIQKARDIIDKESKIIEGARSASETIIEKAEERAKVMTDEHEIVRLAKQKAREIVLFAQQKEKEIKQSAYEYVENTMNNVEDTLKKCLGNIKDIKNTVNQQKKNQNWNNKDKQ